MKKLLIIFFLASCLFAQGTQWSNYARVTTLQGGDVLLMSRSLTMKGFLFSSMSTSLRTLYYDTAYVRISTKQYILGKKVFSDSVSFRKNTYFNGVLDFTSSGTLTLPGQLSSAEGSLAYIGDKPVYKNIGGDDDTLMTGKAKNKFYAENKYYGASKILFDGAFKLTGRDTAKTDYIYSKTVSGVRHLYWRRNDTTAVKLDSINATATAGGWTISGTTPAKIYQSAGSKTHVRSVAGDTTQTSLFNVYGTSDFKGIPTFQDDSLKINGLFYDFPSTRWVGSVPYDSLGNGVLVWRHSPSFKDKIETFTGTKTFNADLIFGASADLTLPTADPTPDVGKLWRSTDILKYTNSVGDAKSLPFGTGTINELAYWSSANSLGTLAVATYPSLTELSYVKGLTSAAQTQLNSKIALTSLSSTATGLTYTNTTGVFSLTAGYVIPTTTEQTNWGTAYTNRITSLTTTGSSGASTLVSNTLNIPQYTLAGLGGITLASLSGVSPISYNSGTGAFSFLFNTTNTWTGANTFSTNLTTFSANVQINSGVDLTYIGRITASGAVSSFILPSSLYGTVMGSLWFDGADLKAYTGLATVTFSKTTHDHSGVYEVPLTFSAPLSRSVNTISLPLTNTYLFVGNGSNIATGVAMSGDATISNLGAVTVADDSHNHNSTTVYSAANLGGGLANKIPYQTAASTTAFIDAPTVQSSLSYVSGTGMYWNAITSANTASAIVLRDGSGNFSAGTITANITGNVSGSSGSTTGNAATVTNGVYTNANNILTGNNTLQGDLITTQENIAVATGTIDVTGMTWVKLETTGGNRTVTTINGGVDGKIIYLYSNDASYSITFDETGNLQLAGSFVMNNDDVFTLMYSTTKTKWMEVSRSSN